MDFFGRQEGARRATRWLVVLFLLAVVAVVVAVDLAVLAVASVLDPDLSRRNLLLLTSLGVLAVIGLASLYRTARLSAGGSSVALALGGRRVGPDSTDPLHRRLVNVVEEMSIASGVPMPEVYVLESEVGINAFAAGFTPADAAVAVTRGALTTLDRRELQGVIGHEFSHILNGDMRLNTRLLGLLYGLMIVALAGRLVLYHLPRAGRRGRNAGAAVFAIGGVAAATLAAGQIGLFFGRLIQAAVSRHRERLADASAVQFNRDSSGLRDALVKIGASRTGSRIAQPAAEEVAHMLFAAARRSAFATHPPLVERIRALDPSFDRAEFGAMRRRLDAAEAGTAVAADSVPDAGAARERLGALLGASVAAPVVLAGAIGNPGPAQAERAQLLLASLPEALHEAAAHPGRAAALLVALALESEASVRQRQLALLENRLGAAFAREVGAALETADGLHAAQRLPALQVLLPATHGLPVEERQALVSTLTLMLGRQGGRLSPFAYALRKLAQVALRDELDPPGRPRSLPLQAVREEAAVLLSALARLGHSDVAAAEGAFNRGLDRLGLRDTFKSVDNWPARLDQALNRLDRLAPAAKAKLVDAMGATIGYDGRLSIEEAELLRAICGALHCPVPPLVDGPPDRSAPTSAV